MKRSRPAVRLVRSLAVKAGSGRLLATALADFAQRCDRAASSPQPGRAAPGSRLVLKLDPFVQRERSRPSRVLRSVDSGSCAAAAGSDRWTWLKQCFRLPPDWTLEQALLPAG